MTEMDGSTLVACLLGEATPAEMRRLTAWRASSPENEEEYRRLQRLWRFTGELTSPALLEPPSPREIVDEARSREPEAPERTGQSAGPGEHPRPSTDGAPGRSRVSGRGRLWQRAGMAAALVVGLGLGLLVESDEGRLLRPEVLVTGVAEAATFTLEDETVVRLAPESRLTVTPGDDAREVHLTGRAYFAVTPNPERPFRVHLPTGEVHVLGTRFDVVGRAGGMQVAVVEGNVRMESLGNRLNVGASQVARVTDAGVTEVASVENVYQVIDWLGQFLAFESTPMERVAAELRRRFGIRIEITDDRLRTRTVTGWFADQSPESLIAGICTVVEARCSVRDGVVRMETSVPDARDEPVERPIGTLRNLLPDVEPATGIGRGNHTSDAAS